jgi:MFS superfamily sulfate permease-like transporter
MKPEHGIANRELDASVPGFWRWIPGLVMARHYQLGWLPQDAVAGMTLSAVLVPAGMAYAEAAGMPVVSGLYSSFAALLAYAVFGPSRILVLGPDSALVALIKGITGSNLLLQEDCEFGRGGCSPVQILLTQGAVQAD